MAATTAGSSARALSGSGDVLGSNGTEVLWTGGTVQNLRTTYPTLVAARDLPAGQVLQVEDLARRDMPSGFLPSGTFADAELAKWKAGDKTEDSFAALAQADSEDTGSKAIHLAPDGITFPR